MRRAFLVCFSYLLITTSPVAQSWQALGPDDFNWPSAGQAGFTNIAFNGATSYVVYRDAENEYKSIINF